MADSIEIFELALNEYLTYHYDKICLVKSEYYFISATILFEVRVYIKDIDVVLTEDERKTIRGDILMVKRFLDINSYITVKFMPTVFMGSSLNIPPFY